MNLPTLSQNQDPALRKLDRAIDCTVGELSRTIVFVIVFVVTTLVCCSCSSTKAVTQLVEHTSIDTVYLSNVQYDSIYIFKDRVSEHNLGTLAPTDCKGQYLDIPMRTDTLYIKDVSIEYRYKMLRDTIYKTQVDSIPYQVTITETKEIQRPLTWYDHFSRAILWLNIGFVIYWLIRLIRKFKA